MNKKLFAWKAKALGDCMLGQTYLRHWKQSNPNTELHLECEPGTEQIFQPVVDHVYPLVHPFYWRTEGEQFDQTPMNPEPIQFVRPVHWYPGHASTKTTQAILQEHWEFDRSLYKWEIHPTAEQFQKVDEYISDQLPSDKPFALIHYKGTAQPQNKDLTDSEAELAARLLIELGITPVVLHTADNSIPFADQQTIFHPRYASTPMFRHEQLRGGLVESGLIAALIQRATALIGIDSGPEHIALATDTPTFIYYTYHHPVTVFDPTPSHITHLVPDDIGVLVPEHAHDYFTEHYPNIVYFGDSIENHLADAMIDNLQHLTAHPTPEAIA